MEDLKKQLKQEKKEKNMYKKENEKLKKKLDKPKKKRALSGYMKFGQSIRPKILKENPGINPIGGVSKKISEEWKKLSAEDQAAWKTK